MPEPLAMPARVTVRPSIWPWTREVLGKVSVVIMAWAASVRPWGWRRDTREGMACSMRSRGNGWPMTPVEAGRSRDSGMANRSGGGLGGGRSRGQTGFAGAGIGIAAIHQDGLGLAPAQPLLAEKDRGGLHFVGGKDPRGGGRLVRHNQGQVQTTGFFDRGLYRGGAESGDDEVFHLVHGIILKEAK